MLVPFGTPVVDRNGKSVGTVSRLVLHPDTRRVVALVVQQGIVDRREVVVALNKVIASSFFVVAGDDWTESVLPFVLVSSAASGVPGFIPEPAVLERARKPVIAKATPVHDAGGQLVGDLDGVELDPASARITRVRVRQGRLFRRELAIPAGVIASVAEDRITLSVRADVVKKLEPGQERAA